MQILRGELPAGAGLPSEDVWSAELDVSRTARRRSRCWRLKASSNRGRERARRLRTGALEFPRPDVLAWRLAALPTERCVRDLFDLRQVIEPNAAALAPERSEKDGHRPLGRGVCGDGGGR